MKKARIALLLSLALLLSSPLSALAATHSVGSRDDIHYVFDTDTDAEVTLNLTDDIDMYAHGLQAGEGQTYTFNTNGNEFSNLVLGGNGSVVINGDISGTGGYDALYTVDGVGITINGSIDATDMGEGINANGTSSITVNGDIIAYNDGVDADNDTTVIVNGSIFSDNDDGVETDEDTRVFVFGNIFAGEDGINANSDEGDGASRVTVFGNVFGGLDGSADGIDVGYRARVTVCGNVSGTDCSVEASGDSHVVVTGQTNGPIKLYDNATFAQSSKTVEKLQFHTTDLNGREWSSADLRGHELTLLVFIDPADAGAAELVAEAQALQAAYGEKLQVLGVLLGNDEAAAGALNAGFPVLRATSSLLDFYGRGLPGMQALAADGSSLMKSTRPGALNDMLALRLA